MTSTASDLMVLPADKRREYFRKLYTVELARLHATGACRWSIDQLPTMVDRVMAALARQEMPIGAAMDSQVAETENQQSDL